MHLNLMVFIPQVLSDTMLVKGLNSTHRDINQLCLQVNDLVHKSHTITYKYHELVNTAKQVKNNISPPSRG